MRTGKITKWDVVFVLGILCIVFGFGLLVGCKPTEERKREMFTKECFDECEFGVKDMNFATHTCWCNPWVQYTPPESVDGGVDTDAGPQVR